MIYPYAYVVFCFVFFWVFLRGNGFRVKNLRCEIYFNNAAIRYPFWASILLRRWVVVIYFHTRNIWNTTLCILAVLIILCRSVLFVVTFHRLFWNCTVIFIVLETVISHFFLLLQGYIWNSDDGRRGGLVQFVGVKVVCLRPGHGSPTIISCIPVRARVRRICTTHSLLKLA